jgi:hypothetical protein
MSPIILSVLRSLKAIHFLDCPVGLCWNPVEKRTDGDWLSYSERFAERGVFKSPDVFQPTAGRG